ncbi:cytochrome P450 [Phaeosphaeriaceae sp. PMI808]|nr:cytochrome P450 [Phaeosphaeriaceae sp. PMI808]
MLQLISLIAALAIILDYVYMLWQRRRLPPGPIPLPIVGNHFQTPSVKPWIVWEKWAQYYDSPMITLWIGRYPRIIFNDIWAASELLEKRADIFSSRPRLIAMGDAINSTKTNQTVLVYGDRWRLHRKLMHAAVGSQAVRNYRDFQAAESHILVRDILVDPMDYVLSIERYTVSVTSIVGWGRRIDHKNDYVAQQALAIMEAVDYIIPGKFIIEAIPWLTRLPAWLYALPTRLRMAAAIYARYFYLLTQEGAEENEKSFAKHILKSQQENQMTDVEVAALMSNLIGGGVDTTSSTMISCILAMACFPEVQAKAHAELDAAVGHQRSPNWTDIDSKALSYLATIVKETLRWRTVTILAGIPHANMKPVNYKGYHFPAGTNFTANMWAIHRHTRDFPDPDNFIPERFLDGAEKRPYPNSHGMNAFGFGRRQCSGQPLAEQGLLYSLARLIWAFDIKPGLDENGNEVKLDIFAYTESENMRPEAFKARFIPRSDSIKGIVLEEAARAREALRQYDGETKVTMEDAVNNPAMV